MEMFRFYLSIFISFNFLFKVMSYFLLIIYQHSQPRCQTLKCAVTSQIANIIGPTLHIDWVIGVWLRSHVHDWANVGVVVHSHAIFADIGPILANDLLLQRIMKVIFFHRNKSGRIFVSHCNIRCTHTQKEHKVR